MVQPSQDSFIPEDSSLFEVTGEEEILEEDSSIEEETINYIAQEALSYESTSEFAGQSIKIEAELEVININEEIYLNIDKLCQLVYGIRLEQSGDYTKLYKILNEQIKAIRFIEHWGSKVKEVHIYQDKIDHLIAVKGELISYLPKIQIVSSTIPPPFKEVTEVVENVSIADLISFEQSVRASYLNYLTNLKNLCHFKAGKIEGDLEMAGREVFHCEHPNKLTHELIRRYVVADRVVVKNNLERLLFLCIKAQQVCKGCSYFEQEDKQNDLDRILNIYFNCLRLCISSIHEARKILQQNHLDLKEFKDLFAPFPIFDKVANSLALFNLNQNECSILHEIFKDSRHIEILTPFLYKLLREGDRSLVIEGRYSNIVRILQLQQQSHREIEDS